MEKQFSYRITKIAGRAVAVAMIGLVAVFSLTVNADPVYLGSQYGFTTTNESSTRVFADGTGWNDSWIVNQDHFNTQSAYSLVENPVVANSQVSLGMVGTAGSYGVNQSRSGDIFYGNSVVYSYGNNSNAGAILIGNVGVTIGGTFNHACGDNSSAWVSCGFGWADAKRESVYVSNKFAQIVDSSTDSYYFGAGSSVDNVTRGSKSYAYFTDSWLDGNNYAYASLGFESGGASQAVGGYAINIDGNAYFSGNNSINGEVRSVANYINGSNVAFNGNVYSGILFEAAGSSILNGGADLTGSVNFQGHNATLTLSNGSNITGSVVNSATDNGTLNFEGSSYVTGAVNAINAVNVKGAGSLVQLNTASGDTTVNTLTISADKAVVEVGGKLTGNVNMGGHFSKLELNNVSSSSASGMAGTLDFGKTTGGVDGKGTLEVGNDVNVTFGAGGIQLTNASNSTLLFAGNSNVSGAVGSSVAAVTPNRIYAGSGTVNFSDLVTVGSGALNVGPSNATVLLSQGLVGNLVFGSTNAAGLLDLNNNLYSTYGDSGVAGTWGNGGTVKVADGKNITGSITSYSTTTGGTLNFLGSSNYGTQAIGTVSNPLTKVVFNGATSGAVTNVISGNVFAGLVEIGNGSTADGSKTTATLTSGTAQTPAVLGNALVLANARTTLNTDATFGTAGAAPSNLVFVKNVDGTLTGAPTQTNVGANGITTNGATLNFSVDAGQVSARNGAVVPSNSSKLTTTGALTLTGGAKINVALMGSVANAQAANTPIATLISGAGVIATGAVTLSHNSFVLGGLTPALTLRQNNGNQDLELMVNRTASIYQTRSETVGHFSNDAADRLGALAAAGAGYTSDMQTVFNKLDIDQWGFGNTKENLATQVKRLAPIANASGAQAALASTSSVLTAVGERLSVLRGDVAMAGLNGNGRQMGTDNTGWVKVLGSSGKAKAIGDYDGYKVTTSGLVAGADAKVGNGVVGGSFSYVASNLSQQDFRLGDSAKLNSGTFAVYGTQEYGDVFVDGALAFSQHSLDSSRATAIARIAKADMDLNQTTVKLSAGYRIGIDDSKVNVLTPMLSVEAASLKQKAYSETGADALSLNVDSKNMSSTRASLGLRFNTAIEGASTTFYPEFLVAVNRNNGMRNTDVVANYAGDTTATAFTTTGVVLPKSSYTVGAGLRFATSKTSEVQIGYRYEGGNGLTGSSAQVRGAWSF
ncbi:autotransporter domain-containing protein [Limnohabitans sp. DCL3]|uniref:autotransporter domain-containing protein n=1 Tax=Limnohabitans sp. DCL3 TaxID=3374103 RepID=UPI003A8C70EC